MASVDMLHLEPKELTFNAVKYHQAQQQTVRITNVLRAPVEGDIRPGSSDRYTVTPSSFRLRPGESTDLTVTLKLDSKFAQRQKATDTGQRDPFYIKTKFFDQRFTSVFYLHPEPDSRSGSTPSSSRPSRAASLSPQRPSPRDDAYGAADLQHASHSPLKARAGAVAGRSNSFGGSTAANMLRQQSSSQEAALLSPPSSHREQRSQSVAASRSSSSAGPLPGFSITAQGQLQQPPQHQDPQELDRPGNAADPAADDSQPGQLRSSSPAAHTAHSSRISWTAAADVPQGSATLKRSSSVNGHGGSIGSSSGRGVLLRSSSDDAGGRLQRRVQKSVSFADLPSWRSPPNAAASEADGAGPQHVESASAAGPRVVRRASDTDLATHRPAASSSSRSEAQQSRASWQEREEHSATSAADDSRSSLSAGLRSWRESLRLAQQQQELPDTEVKQQQAYSSRLHGVSAAAEQLSRPLAAGIGRQTQQPEQQQQQHSIDPDESDEHVQPTGWAPQLAPVREESPGPSPEKANLAAAPPTAGQAAQSSSYSSKFQTAPADRSFPAGDSMDEVAELRAALAAARAELAASHELLDELAAESPDAVKLMEAGAKQEQAVQEVRNRRALELLLQKDNTIRQLQERCKAAEEQLAEQQLSLVAAEARARAGQALQQQLEDQLRQLEQQHMHHLAEVRQAHAAQLEALDDRLAAQTKQLLQAQQEVLQLSNELAKQRQPARQQEPAGHVRPGSPEVSLDKGVAALGPDSSPAAATATSSRRRSTAVQNASAETDAGHLLALLAERDAELATLEAELAVSRAALAGNAELPDEPGGTAAQVWLLQRDLAEAHAALRAQQERLTDLEALQAISQAAAEEGELLAAREQCSAGAARREANRQQTEAEVARLTAARLNARVTELAAELSNATARADQLQQKLQTQQELHERESKAMQKKLAALVAAGGSHLADLEREYDIITASPRKATDQELTLQLAGGVAGACKQPGTSVAATAGRLEAADTDTSREAYLAQALEDAESTVALLQAKLLEATQQQQLAAARLEDMQNRAARAAVRHTQQLVAAKQAGQVQLTALQEAVARLGNRSELAGQAAALSIQASDLKRSEAKLTADVAMLQQQLTHTQQHLEEARSDLQHHQHQQQQVAIQSTYPLMRAAKLLEAVHRLNISSSNASSAKASARPWPSFDASNGHRAQSPAEPLQLKVPADMTAAEQAAAAAAASAWVAEMARTQEMISSLLLRAQRAEMGLAAASLYRDDKQQQQSPQGDVPAAIGSVSTALVPVAKQQGRQAAGGQNRASQGAAAADSEACERLLELQQELVLAQAELRSARQQRELADVEMSRLSAQLEASKAAATAAAGQAGEAEKAAQQRIQAAAAHKIQAAQHLSQELIEAQHHASEAETAAAEAAAERDAANAAAATAKQQLAQLKAEVSRAAAEVAAVKSAAAAQAQDARQQISAKDREIHRLSCEVDSHVTRAAVLLETIETLQAGGGSEQEQRLVGLTAQLAAAHGQAASQDARIRELLDECEARAFTAAQLRQQLDTAQQGLADKSAAVSAADAATANLTKQLEQLRAQVKASGQQVARAARDLSVLKQKLSAAEADAEGLRAALHEAQDRHAHQLQKERDAAAMAAQQALASQLQHHPPHAYVAHVSHMTVVLDDLLTAARAAVNKQAGTAAISTLTAGSRASRSAGGQLGLPSFGSGLSSDVSWVFGAMMKLKELLLESDRLFVKCDVEAQLSAQQASTLTAQLAAAQASVERLTGQWQAAEAAKDALVRAANKRAEHAAVQVVERLHLQESRIEALFSDNQQLCEQLIAAQANSATADTAAAAALRTAHSLSLQLESATAELDSLRRAAAAAAMEAAGYAEWASKHGAVVTDGTVSPEAIGEGVKQRDQSLIKWFEGRVAMLLANSSRAGEVDPTQLMALMRQVCGMKLVESQLLASLAAANARSDAATLRSQCLAAALETATAKAAAAAGASTAQGGVAEGHLSEQVAQLTAQAAARSQEVYRLQDQLLQAKQLLSSRDLEIQELQSQLDEVSQASSAQQAADAAALAAQRAALTAAAAAEEARLRRELQELRQLLDKQSAESSAAISNERLEAARRADDSAAAAVVAAQEAAASALHAAEVKVALLEGQLDVCEQERDMLQEQVYNLESQVADLQAAGEVTGAAVQGLEATLAAIERAESRRASQGPAAAPSRRSRTPPGKTAVPSTRQSAAGQPGSTRTQAGSKRSSRDDAAAEQQQQQIVSSRSGSSDEGEGDGGVLGDAAAAGSSVAVLSRELVKAQMASADLQRKLRVGARSEVELRQRLAERDARLAQLKQQLTDKKLEADALQRRVNELLGSKAGLSVSRQPSLAAGIRRQSSAVASALGFSNSPRALSRSSSAARACVARTSTADLAAGGTASVAQSPTGIVAATTSDEQQTELQQQPGTLENDEQVVYASAHGLAAAEKEYLAHQIAALRISLAKRDAEVARLEGALAEAVAQQPQPAAPTAAITAAAGSPRSRLGSRSASVMLPSQSGHNSPHPSPLGRARSATEGFMHSAAAFSRMRPPSLQLQHSETGAGPLSSLGRGLDSSRGPSSAHSATAAARLARQASLRSAAGQTPAAEVSGAAEGPQQQQQQQDDLAVQLAAANAELASALATARQVLLDLVLGGEAEPEKAAQVQAELSGLGLEEALSEVVYQVQEKLSQAATAAETAIAEATAIVDAERAVNAAAAQAGNAGLSKASSAHDRIRRGGEQLAVPGNDQTAVSLAAERDALVAQLQSMAQQLESVAAEKEALAARLDTAASAREELAKQLATYVSERDSLAQQNTALASALSGRLTGDDLKLATPPLSDSGAVAAAAAAAGSSAGSAAPSPVAGSSSSPGDAPSPAQLKKIGQLMEKLTKENARLIKARDAALADKATAFEQLSTAQEDAAALQRSLEAAERQVSQLTAHRDQLEVDVAALQQQVEELAATQENLMAQVNGCRAERDMLAKENATLAATANQLMTGDAPPAAAVDRQASTAAREGSQGIVFDSGASATGTYRSRTTSAPPTPSAVAKLSAAAAGSSSDGGNGGAKITTEQLKEIGNMLARLTRENAALIKQRDRLEAALAPAQAEAHKATAAAEAAVREGQMLTECRDRLKSELEAAKLEGQKGTAAVRQLSAEKERLQQQVTSLTAERDSMAAQNMTLASATSKLMAAAAGPGSTHTTPFAAAAGDVSPMDSAAAVAALNASIGAAVHLSDGALSHRASATAASDSAHAAQQQHGGRSGGVLSPAQAQEIGALLTRLTNENAAFLKQKDAAVLARDEALNRLTGLQVELDMLQQQHRELELELQHIRSPQHQGDIPSPAHSSASVSGGISPAGGNVRPSMQFGEPGAEGPQQQEQPVTGRSGASTPDANRALQLCRSIQRSVSCAESVHQAMTAANTAANTPRASVSPAAAASAAVASPTVNAEGLCQVLGAELSVLKEAAEALGSQLQQITQQQGQKSAVLSGVSRSSSAARSRRASHERLDFSYNLPQLEIPSDAADLSGFPSSSRQQQQEGARSSVSAAGSPRLTGRTSLQQQQRVASGTAPGSTRPSQLNQQDQQQQLQQQTGNNQIDAGSVQVSVAVLNQLQEAALQQQKRCGKWKAKCKQLAQHIGVLKAQLQQAELLAAAGEGVAVRNAAAGPEQQPEQGATLDEMCAAVSAGQREVRQLREQLVAAKQAHQSSSVDAIQAEALLQRLEATEASAMQRLSSSISAAGTLLNKGEELAGSAAAAAGAVEGQVASLLTAAAGVEARVMGLERRLESIRQAQVNHAEEHDFAIAGATQLQTQLASLQQQLADTTARYATEQQQLQSAVTAAVEAQRQAESIAAEAQEQLAVARDVLAERLGEAERQHKARMSDMQARHQAEVKQLKQAVIEAKNMSQAAAAAAVAQRLAAAEQGRSAAEAALCQMSEEIRAYQAAKAAEIQHLESQIESLMLAAPSTVAAEFADTAAEHGQHLSSSGRLVAGRSHSYSGHNAISRRRLSVPSAVSGQHGLRTAAARTMSRHGGVRLAGKAAGQSAKHGTVGGHSSTADSSSKQLNGMLQKLRQGVLSPESQQAHAAADMRQHDVMQQLLDAHAVAADIMASVRAADALAAAEREANFQRLARHRAEAAADALRAAVSRLKARLKAVKADADDLRKAAAVGAVAAVESASAKEETARALSELAAAKEALKAARAESQRRQRQQAAAVAAAAAAAASGGANSSSSSSVESLMALLSPAGGGLDAGDAAVGDNGRMTGVLMVLQREAAAAAAAGRDASEQKLKEAKATIDRKNLLIRELKSRVEDMSSRLTANPTAALEERAAAAEGRAKQLAASLARKEVSLREAKQALEESKSKVDELAKAAGTAAGGELERQAKMVQRLRAEVTRKEQALQAVTNDLEKYKEQLAAATSAAETAARKQTAAETAARRAAGRQQQRLVAAGHAVKAVASLLLACLATMAAAVTALEQHAQAAAEAAAAAASSAQQPADKLSLRASTDSVQSAAAAAAAMVASGLADMVSLSKEELTDLLGAEDETCKLLMLTDGTAPDDTYTDDAAVAGQPGSITNKRVLMLEGFEKQNQQHQQLQQQLDEAIEQLVNGETVMGVRSSAISSDRDSVDMFEGVQQQQQGLLKGLLLQSVMQALTEEAGKQQENLRCVVVSIACA